MSLEILLPVWAVALVLSLTAIAVIIRPLFVILVEICGSRERARFWTVYSCILTLMAPLLMVSTPGLLDNVAASGSAGAILQRSVFFACGGIIFALLVMGRAVWRSIGRSSPAPVLPKDPEPAS